MYTCNQAPLQKVSFNFAFKGSLPAETKELEGLILKDKKVGDVDFDIGNVKKSMRI